MATLSARGVRIAGIASAVPATVRTVEDGAAVFGSADADKICKSIGVVQRHVATNGICTSDLCEASAKQLLRDLGWSSETVDALILITQSPDYLLPATSCCLHSRLQLSKRCAAFDVSLGCSGYVYGLWLASQIIMAGSANRVLLLAGDTSNYTLSPQDRSVALLFGDAGSATAMERAEGAPPMFFCLGTDGTGQNHLIIPAGKFRHPSTPETRQRRQREDGNVRSDEDLYMNGAEIFAFTLREVPSLLRSVMECAGWDIEAIDAFVMHQANEFMLQHLAKKTRIPAEKLVLDLEKRGNTSSASIPLAIADQLAGRVREGELKLLLAGFGVGFSWGAVALTCGPACVPEVLLIDSPQEAPVTKEVV